MSTDIENRLREALAARADQVRFEDLAAQTLDAPDRPGGPWWRQPGAVMMVAAVVVLVIALPILAYATVIAPNRDSGTPPVTSTSTAPTGPTGAPVPKGSRTAPAKSEHVEDTASSTTSAPPAGGGGKPDAGPTNAPRPVDWWEAWPPTGIQSDWSVLGAAGGPIRIDVDGEPGPDVVRFDATSRTLVVEPGSGAEPRQAVVDLDAVLVSVHPFLGASHPVILLGVPSGAQVQWAAYMVADPTEVPGGLAPVPLAAGSDLGSYDAARGAGFSPVRTWITPRGALRTYAVKGGAEAAPVVLRGPDGPTDVYRVEVFSWIVEGGEMQRHLLGEACIAPDVNRRVIGCPKGA